MPGLRFPGPPTTVPNGSYSFFHDVQTPTGKDGTWDPVDINSVNFAAVEAVPFVPNKHKACRPPQFHAAWIKGKAGSATNAFNGLGCSLSTTGTMSAPVQGNGSNDSDDLAAMVLDFIESGSPAFLDASDSDNGPPNILQLRDTLEGLISSYGRMEAELVIAVRKLILAIDVDNDLICNSGGTARDCRCGCIKRLVVNQLRAAGYDAAVCKSKWEGSGRVLGGPVHMGEYEYIDVEVYCNQSVERLIVDVDFQDQFVLARATPNYLTSLKLLPTVFVGTTKRLEQILQIMAEAVKVSLKHNSMPLPPWRTLDFMKSKWLSPHERVADHKWGQSLPRGGSSSLILKGRLASTPETRQCDVQLRRIKDSLLSEVNHGSTVNVPGRGRTRHYSKPRAKRSMIL
ncbi:hypothetical protein M758_12G174400 [Ceratodon purpureus]|nr:hypothetical protein M758_12G174400 [Ceratodon purpureus]